MDDGHAVRQDFHRSSTSLKVFASLYPDRGDEAARFGIQRLLRQVLSRLEI